MKKQVLPILLALIMILVPSTVAFAAGGPGSLGGVADITSFKIKVAEPATYGTTVIDGSNITVTVPYAFYAANKSSIAPVIETADGTTVFPLSGATQNFTTPVTYTTTNGNNTEVYTVTVKPDAASKTNDITSFKLTPNGGTTAEAVAGLINGTNITVVVPYSVNRSALDATIAFNGVKLERLPSSVISDQASTEPVEDNGTGYGIDFSAPVQYKVTAQDEELKDTDRYKTYTVTVTNAPVKNTNDITSFKIGTAIGVIDQAKQTINVLVPFTDNLAALSVPVVEHNGESYTPDDQTNFSADVTYTVVSESNLSKSYTVTVKKEDPTKTNSVTSFVADGVAATITEKAGTQADPSTITVVVPYNATLTDLPVTLKHNGIDTLNITITQGKLNYTTPIVFQVKAQNTDVANKYYKLTITKADPTSTKDITSFKIGDAEGVITGQAIAVTVPYGTDIRALVPVIEYTGASIAPDPEDGTPRSFTNPVLYIVKAENNSIKEYTVTVTTAPATKEITSFKIGDIVGTIGDGTVAIEVPFGTDVTALAPTIVHNGSAITPASGIAQNFTNSVTYKVTAQDNTTKDYVVTVTVGDKPEPTPPATKVGWDHSTGIWKYIKADGSPQTGWFYDGTTYKSWFYFSANGNMVSGKWLQDGGKWYYLTGNGKMAIGTYTINGKTQSFAGNGVWKG